MQKLNDFKLEGFGHTYVFMKVLEFILFKNYENLIAVHIEEISSKFQAILEEAQNKFKEKYSFNCFYQLLRLLKKLINILEIFPKSL